MESWHIALIEPQGERIAAAALRARGYEVYYPSLPKKTHREHRVVRTIMRPMFPGYMFVNQSPFGWERLRTAPGIRIHNSLLMINEHFAVLPEGEIGRIAAKEREEIAKLTAPETPESLPYSVGDTVQVVDGPFEGRYAKIETLDDFDRIALLMSIFGRESRVFASHEHLAPIGS